MKYYVTSDPHGFFTPFQIALKDSGFFQDSAPHKLIVLGDLFDRGAEAFLLQSFIQKLINDGQVILIKGNHEDLFQELVTVDNGLPYSHHVSNGTYDTALQLTGYDFVMARIKNYDFAETARNTPYYKQIIPAMVDYYETEHYIFTHGWLPCSHDNAGYGYNTNWRKASPEEWYEARWINGMDAAKFSQEEKTVVCGHWHCSYGHANYEHKCSEFGIDADFSPYYAPGIIALDACTAFSGKVNVLVIED